MVPLDRALVSSYRLSIVIMSPSAAVWPQFVTHVCNKLLIYWHVEVIRFTGTIMILISK